MHIKMMCPYGWIIPLSGVLLSKICSLDWVKKWFFLIYYYNLHTITKAKCLWEEILLSYSSNLLFTFGFYNQTILVMFWLHIIYLHITDIMHRPDTNHEYQKFFQFDILINFLDSSFRFIWIPMLWVYEHWKYLKFFSAGTVFIR